MTSLDSAIHQRLQNLKASNPQLFQQLPGPGVPVPPFPGSVPPPNSFVAPPAGVPPPAGLNHAISNIALPIGIMGGPTLSLALDGLPFKYRLVENDLGEMFSRWGPLRTVEVNRSGTRDIGTVNFADATDASDAQRQLNGYRCVMDGSSAVMTVIFGGADLLTPPPMAPPPPALSQAPPAGPLGGPPPVVGGPPGTPGSSPSSALPPLPLGTMAKAHAPVAPHSVDMSAPTPGAVAGKGGAALGALPAAPFVCRVYTHAERLHPDFPTALKIEGIGSANLNHIRTQNAPVVIQLRGQRSGFLEPDSRQELPDAMHLQISSEDPVQGSAALEMVQDLLRSIYDSHSEWCKEHQQPEPGQIEPAVLQGVEWCAPPCGPGPGSSAVINGVTAMASPKAAQIQQLGPQMSMPPMLGKGAGKGDFQGKGEVAKGEYIGNGMAGGDMGKGSYQPY